MELRLRRELHIAGYTDGEIRRALRVGDLCPVRRGAYVAGPVPDDLAAKHLVEVRAAVEALSSDAIVSHVSAVLMHGLPVWSVPLDRVQITRDRRRTGARRGRRLHTHSARVDADEIVLLHGIAATSPARTMLDVARSLPFEQAVVIVDAALRRELVDADGLGEAIRRHRGWPGLPAARRVFAFADGRSDNPGESRSRVAIARAGLPAPELQAVIRAGADGRFIGQVDFHWKAVRTVGEFDGKIKYGRLLKPGQDPGEVVFIEKLREDDLRAEDQGVVRWTWPDLTHFTPVANRIRTRFRPR